ncbi:hypothetical protein AVEN_75381-1 [Araneus ventricosus]|uniref:Uncharacterized protein n=1 Tax=Araneus ventricosus TaxID=182803 RepID=A0A4Y2RZI8_ARAVE|nr:hypothetical protein AVEN_71293-1 [Araneus ventricosus]GBN80415.1 hypothetical protein AVEN_75381-1 [Araneus ventricosus]
MELHALRGETDTHCGTVLGGYSGSKVVWQVLKRGKGKNTTYEATTEESIRQTLTNLIGEVQGYPTLKKFMVNPEPRLFYNNMLKAEVNENEEDIFVNEVVEAED